MKVESWTRYLVAAVLVLLAGAVWVLAEDTTMRVEVRSEDGNEMTVDVNGVTQIIKLEDLADGEERTYDVGGREVTVKRVGDSLSLVHDGLLSGHHIGGQHQKIWVEGDDESPREHRVMIMKGCDGHSVELDVDSDTAFLGAGPHATHDVFFLKSEDGEIDIEALKEKYGEDFEEFYTAHGAHVMKWVDEEDGEHPIIVKRFGHPGVGDYVTYRCEETGSMLTVKADDNLLDDYLDPVTGCVMKKVEHADVHMIRIQEEKICEGEDEDE